MNRIDTKFQQLRKAKKKAFIAFITAGDPSLRDTERLTIAFDKAGVDIIELGVPFSDPLADGPVIQGSSFRALQRGVTLRKILDAVKRIRRVSDVPIALMTYYNPVFHFGEERFVKAAEEAGVDGLIVPDLPPAEAGCLCRAAQVADVSTVFFLAPTTTCGRMPEILKASTGFVYFVSVAGVTGARKNVSTEIVRNIRTAKGMTDKPVCVGFGVSTPAQVRDIARVADGVIVGSAIIKKIEKYAGKKDMVARVADFVRSLVKAAR